MKSDKARQILTALGDVSNIAVIEPCITRLRVEVTDPERIDEAALKSAGALGVVVSGRIVQVIVGPEADGLATAMNELAAAQQ